MRKRPSKKTLAKELEKLHGTWVRQSGVCWARGKDTKECAGPLQFCHIWKRSQSDGLKYSPLNAVSMCKAHHAKYTFDEVRWTNLVNKHLNDRMVFLESLADWFSENRALVGIVDTWLEHRAFYKSRIEDKDPLLFKDSWLEWHLGSEEYTDFLEQQRDRLEAS